MAVPPFNTMFFFLAQASLLKTGSSHENVVAYLMYFSLGCKAVTQNKIHRVLVCIISFLFAMCLNSRDAKQYGSRANF